MYFESPDESIRVAFAMQDHPAAIDIAGRGVRGTGR